MAEGINMGRQSPWKKEEYVSVYNRVSNYAKGLSIQLLKEEGTNSAADAVAAYNIYKCPAIYLFVHYHYGKFDDLGLDDAEISAYLMIFLPNVKYFARELRNAYATGQIFLDDPNNELASKLMSMCDEIIYIEENY